MILKIGYYAKEKISSYKYYEDFYNLVVEPFDRTNCYIENEKVYCNDGEIFPDYYGFQPSSIKEKLYLNIMWFYENATGKHITIVAQADTVFLMNNNGKTVDKY